MKYLEDQCETYAGLNAAVQMLTALGDTTNAAIATTMANNLAAGIEAVMWNAGTNSYDWAIDSAGTHTTTDWSNMNDTMQNAWAVAYGLATGARAVGLMNSIRAVLALGHDPRHHLQPVHRGCLLHHPAFSDDCAPGWHAVLSHAATNHLAYPYGKVSANPVRRPGVTMGSKLPPASRQANYTFGDPQ